MEDKKPNNPYVHPIQENTLTNYNGITLRDYFASKAMAGIISNQSEIERLKTLGTNTNDFISIISYNVADAMLKQREL